MRFTTGFATAAAVLMTGIAAPAFAETKPGTPAPVATASAEQVAKDRRYCVKEVFTGSRIPQKICKTRSEWMDEGFDPLDPK